MDRLLMALLAALALVTYWLLAEPVGGILRYALG